MVASKYNALRPKIRRILAEYPLFTTHRFSKLLGVNRNTAIKYLKKLEKKKIVVLDTKFSEVRVWWKVIGDAKEA